MAEGGTRSYSKHPNMLLQSHKRYQYQNQNHTHRLVHNTHGLIRTKTIPTSSFTIPYQWASPQSHIPTTHTHTHPPTLSFVNPPPPSCLSFDSFFFEIGHRTTPRVFFECRETIGATHPDSFSDICRDLLGCILPAVGVQVAPQQEHGGPFHGDWIAAGKVQVIIMWQCAKASTIIE